ncbi:MAG: hypothetical protein ACOC5T_02225 [Elusimicrobiota bacterium]
MKEIYIEKVKINKIGSLLYFIGFLFMLISGIVLMFKTDSTDRMQVVAWFLLGVAGYFLYSRFDHYVYSEIWKEPKKIKIFQKFCKKEVRKLARYFIILFISSHIINIATFFYLLGTDLPNLAILILYFPIALGWATIIIVYGTLLFLWKNGFELKKIIEKLKKTKRGGDNE